MQPVKLSPSLLSIYKDCPRCFWLHVNKEHKRPEGIKSRLPNGLDYKFKNYFDKYRKLGALPPEIENGIKGKLFDDWETLNLWRTKGITYLDRNLNLLIKGILDDCLQTDAGLSPFDFKTHGYSQTPEDSIKYYQDQLNIYSFLLFKNGHKISNVGYLLHYHPQEVKENGIINFAFRLQKIPTSVEDASSLIEEAAKLLKGPQPQSHKECEYCNWLSLFS